MVRKLNGIIQKVKILNKKFRQCESGAKNLKKLKMLIKTAEIYFECLKIIRMLKNKEIGKEIQEMPKIEEKKSVCTERNRKECLNN